MRVVLWGAVIAMAAGAIAAGCKDDAGGRSGHDMQKGQNGAAYTIPDYSMEYDMDHFTGRIALNGIPVVQTTEWGQSGIVPVTRFIQMGKNVISVDAMLMKEEFAAPLVVRIVRWPTRLRNVPFTVVGSIELKPTGSKVVRSSTIEFEATMPTQWAWQDATPLMDLAAVDRIAIYALLEKLHAAIVAKNVDGMAELLMLDTKDRAIVNGVSREQVVQESREWLRKMSGAAEYAPKLKAAADLSFVLGTTGVLVTSKTAPRGNWVLTTMQRQDGEVVESKHGIPSVLVVKIGGEWRILKI